MRNLILQAKIPFGEDECGVPLCEGVDSRGHTFYVNYGYGVPVCEGVASPGNTCGCVWVWVRYPCVKVWL